MILSQEDRVRLNRNFSWQQQLDFTLLPYPTGQNFQTIPINVEDAQAPPVRKQQKSKTKKSASRPRSRKRKEPSEESEEEEADEEDYEPPPKRKRILEPVEVKQKYDDLVVLAQYETDTTIKQWLQQNYPQFVKSITITGKQQTLRTLANLLTSDL